MHLKEIKTANCQVCRQGDFVLRISHEQKQSIKEEAQRWDMNEREALEFILRWGFEDFFRSK